MLKKRFGPIFKEFLNFLPKILSLSSQKYGFGIRDPASEIRDPEKIYSGSRGQKGTLSRIRIRNTASKYLVFDVVWKADECGDLLGLANGRLLRPLVHPGVGPEALHHRPLHRLQDGPHLLHGVPVLVLRLL